MKLTSYINNRITSDIYDKINNHIGVDIDINAKTSMFPP